MMRSRRMLLSASATAALLGSKCVGRLGVRRGQLELGQDDHARLRRSIVNVTTNVEPEGIVQVEKMQINIGDTKARAIVNGIINNAGGTERALAELSL